MSASNAVITGRVTDGAGGPVSGAIVAIVSGTSPFPEIAAVTSGDGTFHLGGLQPGTYVLRARHGGAQVSAEVDAVADSSARIEFAIGC